MYLFKTRRFIAHLLCALILLCMVLPCGSVDAAMAKSEKWVGQIISNSVPSNFATYWNQSTPENATKWGDVEKDRGNRKWVTSDKIYNYCKSNGFPFKFHVLVWGSQEPTWIGRLSADQQKAAVIDWIKAAGEQYPDADFVDVVNEPLHSPASFRNALGGSGSTGWDWIVWSFEQARKAFPNSKLLINEYAVEADQNAANQYIKIIKILKDRGLVDGIGLQCHCFNLDTASANSLKSVLNSYAQLGLPIYVSELDLTGDDSTQLARYKEKFPIYYEHPSVKGVTLWGWIENQTWRSGTHLISTSGQERPALKWLKEYLAKFPPASPTNKPTPTPTNTPTPTTKPSNTPTPTNPPAPTGDLNNDGVINMLDVVLLAKAFNSVKGDSRYVAAYDFNGDTSINMKDVVFISSRFNTKVGTRT